MAISKDQAWNFWSFAYFTYKGKQYRRLGLLDMKCPSTGKWLKAVRYEQLGGGQEYVRELADFVVKFKGVPAKDLAL